MSAIDSHNHFWKFDPVRDSWINDEMSVIQHDFLPVDFHAVLKEHGFEGCVVVQSDQSERENLFQLKNAKDNDFIKGIVGWVDLQSRSIEERLEYYSSFEKMKGFRHVLQGEADRALMLRPTFKQGVSLLKHYGFTYDVLIFPDQLAFTRQLVSEFPDQKFVIDHIAKPAIAKREIEDWRRDIKSVAACENVYCKISGMVTEADWSNWKNEDFHPYLDVVVEAFGTNRIMYGSDWPVCLVAGNYTAMLQITKDYFSDLSENEQAAFFGGNAAAFYNLKS